MEVQNEDPWVIDDVFVGPFEEKVEDGMVYIKFKGCWYASHDAVLDYFPFADLDNDELYNLNPKITYYKDGDNLWYKFQGEWYLYTDQDYPFAGLCDDELCELYDNSPYPTNPIHYECDCDDFDDLDWHNY